MIKFDIRDDIFKNSLRILGIRDVTLEFWISLQNSESEFGCMTRIRSLIEYT